MTELEFADVDLDGDLDIVSIGDHGNPGIGSGEEGLMVWFGNGAGAWSHYQTGDFGYGGIAVGDVNGDGLPDVAYGMHHNYSSTDFGDQLIEVALGDGTGRSWIPWDDGLATNGESYGMFAEDFADVDLDGDLDLASLSFGSGNGFHVYLNQGDGTWRQSFARVGDNCTTNEIVFGDVNADGAPDIAVGYQHGAVWLGDGAGGFALADGNLPAGGLLGRRGSDLADVDHDGKDDLVIVNTSGGVDVWLWRGASTWLQASSGLPASGSFETTQFSDMNGDGTTDVAAFGAGLCTVWTGDGGSAWTQAASFTVPSPGDPAAFRVGGDADHNGRPDIVLVADEWISVWNTRNKLRFFKETASVGALSARVLAPRGGEVLAQGSVRFIEWAAAVPAGQTATVRLELSTTGAGGPWTVVADNLPNNGRRQWIVPTDVVSPNCFIRCTITAATSVAASSPSAFHIAAVDSDGDGAPNWSDCALADGAAHAPPAEVAGVAVERIPSDPTDTVRVRWTSQSESAGSGTVYDVISGPVADLGADGTLDLAVCRGENVAPDSTSFALPVALGDAHFVLVRARNLCGGAGYGATSAGAERTSSACAP